MLYNCELIEVKQKLNKKKVFFLILIVLIIVGLSIYSAIKTAEYQNEKQM